MFERRELLESEIRQLQEIIAELPEESVLDRLSLQSRLEQAAERLALLPLDVKRTRTIFTFRGRPVRGSFGMSADFGGRISKSFSDAYASVLAGLKADLRYMGPIPDRATTDLLITGTAVGSFGFEFSLPPVEPDLLTDGLTLEARAVERVRALLEVSAKGTDEEISDIVDDVHPRAKKEVSEFVTILAQSEAMCSLEIGGRSFRFDNVEQVRRSSERLADSNIREGIESLRGAFIGVLPKSRNFEFQIADNQNVIRGRLSPAVEDPDVINTLVGVLKKVSFSVVQVGLGRPRYTLMTVDSIRRDDGS